jgi:hypothetical protein
VAQESSPTLKKNSFFDGRRGNVYENKGPLWKTLNEAGNVIENKGS